MGSFLYLSLEATELYRQTPLDLETEAALEKWVLFSLLFAASPCWSTDRFQQEWWSVKATPSPYSTQEKQHGSATEGPRSSTCRLA